VVDFAEYPGLEAVLEAVWVRDYPEEHGGFQANFIDDSPDYCSRRDNVRHMQWDSLGHLDLEEESEGGASSNFEGSSSTPSDNSPSSSTSSDPESSSSSSSSRACYEVRLLGRFNEGPCSSSSSSASCSSSLFCQDDNHKLVPAEDLEEPPKELKLCFDELGHLISIYVCGQLRWHQDGWYESSTDPDAEPISSSYSRGEGVEILVYYPVEASSSSSSSSCDSEYVSHCEAMDVWRTTLAFDGLGHLFMVYRPELSSLPCGIQTACCVDAMPRSFLVTFKAWNAAMGAGESYADEQCLVVHWNGCWWPGAVNIPCCVRNLSSFTFEVTEEAVDFKIGCTQRPTNPQTSDPWVLCLGEEQYPILSNSEWAGCCPLDVTFTRTYSKDGCDDVGFRMTLSEIPCNIQCVSGTFDCDTPSSSSTTGPSSSESVGDPGPPIDCPTNYCKYLWNPEGGLGGVGQWELDSSVGCGVCTATYSAPPPEEGQPWILYVCCQGGGGA
jgi:hypothetical protein